MRRSVIMRGPFRGGLVRILPEFQIVRVAGIGAFAAQGVTVKLTQGFVGSMFPDVSSVRRDMP